MFTGLFLVCSLIVLCSGQNDDIIRDLLKNQQAMMNRIETLVMQQALQKESIREMEYQLNNIENTEAVLSDIIREIRELKTKEKHGRQGKGPWGTRAGTYVSKEKRGDLLKSSRNVGLGLNRNKLPHKQRVAFYAYLSKDDRNTAKNHTIIYDAVKTNLASGYNNESGIFTVPDSGCYVLTWTVFSEGYGIIYSQLVVNGVVLSGVKSDSDGINDNHSSTGIVVVELNKGDVLYTRTHPTSVLRGQIRSGGKYQSSFSGWNL